MNLTRCKHGHFYDCEKYDACPHCQDDPSTGYFEKKITDNYQWNYLQKIKGKLLAIDHKNIEKIYDLYSAAGGNYVRKEFIQGLTVENLIRDENISLEIFLNIGLSVCDALQYLNECDLVYMDIKPSNIMYNIYDKKVALIDIESVYFKKINITINYFGTIEYSSPEQILYSKYDIRGSIYSLGLVFYKMLTGSLPFDLNKYGLINKTMDRLKIEVAFSDDSKYKIKLLELIKKMITKNENERISLENIISDLYKIMEEADEEELKNNIITKSEENKKIEPDFDDDRTYAIFDDSMAMPQIEIPPLGAPSMNGHDPENSVFWENNVKHRDLTYRTELLKEYHSILIQTKVLFWCWFSAVLMCYVIVFFCIYLILNKRFIDSACSLVLEGLVYAVQKIFSIREDHYRELINNKIVHLQKGDSIEYAISKMEIINDIGEKDKKIMEIIDDIRKICD